MTLEDVFVQIDYLPTNAWLYLPSGEDWALESPAAILVSEEVAEDEEDQPDAGVPEYAKAHGLRQVLPVPVVGDILANLESLRPSAGSSEMLSALMFYWRNDAFGPY